jgi:cation diffusion facilitator CzcD-associated flavoprotein CzcO
MTTKQGNAAVHVDALVIGTGFSGIGMGIALQNAGVDFLILEKADEFGGTWRDNSYPGCACDIPLARHVYGRPRVRVPVPYFGSRRTAHPISPGHPGA